MYLGCELGRRIWCGCRGNTILKLNCAPLNATGVFAIHNCCVEKPDELLLPVLPGSEQLRLQHSRAIAASGPWLLTFLQQSGKFDIGHEPSC
jgi:hypothetical protein